MPSGSMLRQTLPQIEKFFRRGLQINSQTGVQVPRYGIAQRDLDRIRAAIVAQMDDLAHGKATLLVEGCLEEATA